MHVPLRVLSQSSATGGFRHYTAEDGLVNNVVNSIFQDSKGYLWFCTDGGVSRFDGYTFENFTKADGLTDHVIFLAKEDGQGKIWLTGLSNELCYYYNGRIHAHPYNERITNLKIPRSYKFSMVISGDTIKIGTAEHGCYEITSKGFLSHELRPEGTNLIHSDKGDLIFSVKMKDLTQPTIHINGKGYRYDFTNYAGNGVVYIKTIEEMAYLIDGPRLMVVHDSIRLHLRAPGVIRDVFKDDNEGYYLSLQNGPLLFYNKLNLQTTSVVGISDYVSGISEDMEEGVWMQTQGQGVFYRLFGHHVKPVTQYFASFNNHVSEIAFTADNKAVINFNNEFTVTWTNAEGISTDPYPLSESGKSHPFFMAKNGDVLLVKDAWDLFHAEIERMKLHDSLCPQKPNRLSDFYGTDTRDFWIVVDSKGYFHFENGRLIEHIARSKPSHSIPRNMDYRSRALYFNRLSRNFVASYFGGIFEISKGKLISLQPETPFSDEMFNDITELDPATFLFAGTTRGLVIMRKDSIFTITNKNGLSENNVNCIAVDADSMIWAGTATGLNRIDLRAGKSVNQVLTVLHGLPSNNVTALSVNGNELWVGTSKGLVIFDRTKIKPNIIPPFMHITGLKVDENDTVLQDGYKFPYDQNYFVINYTGIAFKNAGNLDYEYQLEGIDKNWQSTKTRSVRYNKVDPGKYTFRVKAANEDGYWSDTASLSFTVLPPFWHTWWFYAFEVLTLLGLIAGYTRWRIGRIRGKEAAHKQEIEFKRQKIELELKALRSQMNPHFTFNTLNAIQDYILSNDSIKANNYLARFAALIRRVLENSRHSTISLDNEVRTLQMYLDMEVLRFPQKLSYGLDLAPDLEMGAIRIPPTLIQPFVENAIVHGIMPKKTAGRVEIAFRNDNDKLYCSIRDNGIGREKARHLDNTGFQKKDHLGMQIITERFELLKLYGDQTYDVKVTDLTNEANEATGTLVELWITCTPEEEPEPTNEL